ncbi:MAG: HAD family hydrolase [Bdellovibrionales bacterium]|nr:HAD family hydrolase [Bdellovibrionales bacterium]
MTLDSIIFDLDGTLWDTTASCASAWNQCYEKRGIDTRITQKDMHSHMGLDAKQLQERFPMDESKGSTSDFLQDCLDTVVRKVQSDHPQLYPYVDEGLHALAKKFPLFIVSNCQANYIETFLEKTGYHDLFTDFESFGRSLQPKEKNIQSIVERNHLKAPVYVGDTEGDYVSAQSAKVPFIHVTYGFGSVQGDMPTFSSFRDLFTFLSSQEKQ